MQPNAFPCQYDVANILQMNTYIYKIYINLLYRVSSKSIHKYVRNVKMLLVQRKRSNVVFTRIM